MNMAFRFGRGLFVVMAVVLLAGSVWAAQVQYTIKMANPSNPEDNCVQGFFKFKELVETRSKGEIAVEVFHSGQLGAHRDYIEGMRMGSIQMAEVNTAVLSAFDSQFMVFDLPYIARGMDHLLEVLESGLGKQLSDQLAANIGIKVAGWMVRSPRCIYNSLRPINKVEDFSGMKIRIMESPLMTKTFSYLGAVPVPLAATERYMALQTKVVDAAENSVPIIIAQKEYEVTKYLSITEHFNTPNIMAMDMNFYNKLPADFQKIVDDAAVEASAYATMLDRNDLKKAIDTLKGLGMDVNEVPDKTAFIERVKPLYDEYRKEIGGDIIDAFLK